MDFSTVDIIAVLRASLPVRFSDMSPSDFEDFIAQLFRNRHYKVDQTPYSGDFGADLLVEKSGVRQAVQVKRYAEGNKVGVPDVNQVLGAKDYYKAAGTIVITTSDFTEAAKQLATATCCELWDWQCLQTIICDTYLGGKDCYAYFGTLAKETSCARPDFRVRRIEYGSMMEKLGSCTLIYATLTNATDKNITVSLSLPLYIRQDRVQIRASYWYTGYFMGGTVYVGCSVELAFMFRSSQLPAAYSNDRIIYEWSTDDDDGETHTADVEVGPLITEPLLSTQGSAPTPTTSSKKNSATSTVDYLFHWFIGAFVLLIVVIILAILASTAKGCG